MALDTSMPILVVDGRVLVDTGRIYDWRELARCRGVDVAAGAPAAPAAGCGAVQ